MQMGTTDRQRLGFATRSLSLLIALLGITLLAGGLRLIALTGSCYYALLGSGLLLTALLVWRRGSRALLLYSLVFLAATIWALSEVGLNAWGLIGRLALLAVIGVLLFCSGPRFGVRRRVPALISAAVLALVVLISIFVSDPIALNRSPSSSSGLTPSPHLANTDSGREWRWYGGSLAGTHFSPLSQITPQNVAQLRSVWIYRTGDLTKGGTDPIDELGGLRGLHGVSGFQATALQVGKVVYTCTERNSVVALDAETGAALWRFDPHWDGATLTHSTCRGVTYYERSGESGPCASRLFHGSLDGRLWALDARTGAPCSGFGAGGSVSLRDGLSNPGIGYHMTSPGTIANGLIVVGAWVPDNLAVQEPSGVVRAYDVISGRLVWAWDVGRADSRPPSLGETFTAGTPNVWSLASADEALNLVYVPTGNATPDIWGGKRRSFDDRYSSSVVALDLVTGQPRWSFQTAHHDLWDYDVPAQPVLFDIPFPDGTRPALIQATKQGEIFVLDRRTGQPLLPIEERRVPGGAAPGDYVAPTQPFSAISVRGPDLTEQRMWGLTPLDQLWCRIRFREARYAGLYTPPGERPTINYPGSFGAISWGGLAIDEPHHLLITNSNSIAYYMQLVPRASAPQSARRLGNTVSYQWLPMEGTPYVARIRPFVSPLGIPCNAPPWGQLQAIDLVTGKTLWRRRIGTTRDSGPFGLPTELPLPIGTPAQGGPIATAGGVTFLAATADNYLRAFETATGRELWRGRLPAGGQATPMTFISPQSGRQFVVVSAGGHTALKTKRGDYIMAFALTAVPPPPGAPSP